MKIKTDTYYKNKFTLKYYNKRLESDYLDSIFDFKKMQMLFIMGLTFFIYVLYIGFDFFLLNEQERTFAVPFHISMILLWIYLIPSIYYNIFRKFAIFILYLMPIYAVLGTLVFAYYHNPVYIIEIYVILFWSFVSIGYMFLASVIISSIMATSSAVILYAFNVIVFEAYILHIFTMTVAWVLGLSASYLIELYSRNNYENEIEILQMQDELKELSHRDYLTNLYNRRYFNELAQNFMKTAKRDNTYIAVIMLDIDKFKNINDTYGHIMGDEVIKQLASLLKKHMRESDIVSRFGGEEFAVLLPHTNKEEVAIIAEELRVIVENQDIKIANDKYINFTVSLGVACVDLENDHDISEALDRADKALYRAKEKGRNRVMI